MNKGVELFTVGIDGGMLEIGINHEFKEIVTEDEFLDEKDMLVLHAIAMKVALKLTTAMEKKGLV